ncbi:MAG TPA: efflux RND transporter periplasmic adaptor subunit [Bryobacteraceae bacterium]|nr:efflux RND transporter periplasmic adaptor subunit [Bryobacteraceae bacterium]
MRLLIPALILLAAAPGCRRQEVYSAAPSEAPPVKAALVKLEPRPFTLTIAITGTLVSSTRVDVKAETTGRVVRFDKKEGDRVAAGETIVWVNQEKYQLAVRQAESAVQVAEASLEKARVLDAHSRAELERAQNLLASGGITDRDLKTARVTEQDARAQVALASAQLDQARASLEVTRKALRDTAVRAPVAGEIQRKYINPGAYVEPPTALFTLVDNTRLELESPVATADLGTVRRGQKVTFTVNSYPGEVFEGSVEEVNPAIETESRSARVRIRVGNSGGRLKGGMFAQGEILTGVQANALIIPGSAIYRDDRASRDAHVFLAENGRAVRRQVKVGRERDLQVEIVQGLKPGDLLVAEQSIEIAEGVRVAAR